jgi:hypothetical protein
MRPCLDFSTFFAYNKSVTDLPQHLGIQRNPLLGAVTQLTRANVTGFSSLQP